jgi:hypothetical protein
VTKLQNAKLAVALVCALILGVACSGGGGGAAGASPPPPPMSPPPPPPPPPVGPPEPPLPPPGVIRPTLFIEKETDGTTYIRVLEQVYDPFAPNAPQRTIANMAFGPAPGVNVEIMGDLTTLVRNVDVVDMKHGLQILGTNTLSIYDYTYTRFAGDGSIHGAAIKLGDGVPTNGAAYIQRVFADGFQAPDGSYQVGNTDFIGVELDSGPVYIRDVTGRRFSDGGVDSKSSPVIIMNATLFSGNRMIRAWGNVEFIIVNSIINASPGDTHAWIFDNTSTVRYYNTLWCENAVDPSPTNPDCRTTPWNIQGEEIDEDEAAARIFQAASNPLPANNPFFHTQVERIVLQYSADGGATWQDMSVPNTGGIGSAPIGDPRYRIPLDLASANYVFRAWYEQNGAKIGETSLVVDEAGLVVP